MDELTPERLRDAADVLDALSADVDPFGDGVWSATAVRREAARIEHLLAAEAERAARIEELTQWVKKTFYSNEVGDSRWRALVGIMVDRYPSLLDDPS